MLFIFSSASDFVSLVTAGFAFVYFMDERDAEDAIRGLDGRPFGYDRRKLSVEWAKVQSCTEGCFFHPQFLFVSHFCHSHLLVFLSS